MQSGNPPVHTILISMLSSGVWTCGSADEVRALCSLWVHNHVKVLYTEREWRNAEESPGLSCCCTFYPREILSFLTHTHRHTHFPLCTRSSGHRDELSWGEQELRRRKWASRLLLFSSSCSFSLLGDGYVQCWNSWSGWSRESQTVCADPPCYTVAIFYKVTTHERQLLGWKISGIFFLICQVLK